LASRKPAPTHSRMIGHRLASASLGVSLCMAISGIIRPKHCAAEFWKLGTPQKNCSDEEQIRVDVRRLRPAPRARFLCVIPVGWRGVAWSRRREHGRGVLAHCLESIVANFDLASPFPWRDRFCVFCRDLDQWRSAPCTLSCVCLFVRVQAGGPDRTLSSPHRSDLGRRFPLFGLE
jgi:hypothetical protein